MLLKLKGGDYDRFRDALPIAIVRDFLLVAAFVLSLCVALKELGLFGKPPAMTLPAEQIEKEES